MSVQGGMYPTSFNVLRGTIFVVYGEPSFPAAYAVSSREADIPQRAQPLEQHYALQTQAALPEFRRRETDNRDQLSALELTRRQRDVLYLIVKGHSNKEIARALNLAEGTIKIHVAALFGKLGVSRRSAVALAATRFLSGADS